MDWLQRKTKRDDGPPLPTTKQSAKETDSNYQHLVVKVIGDNYVLYINEVTGELEKHYVSGVIERL